MLVAKVLSKEWEIDARLNSFGVSREELIAVVREVVAARSVVVEDDVAGASGQLAYIFGSRHVIKLFRSKGWLRHRTENIESVRQPKSGITVVYQSVDLAADNIHLPLAVSGKGSGASRMIDSAQGSLFDSGLPHAVPKTVEATDKGAWFFCVSVNGDDVRAELSLPATIEGSNFHGFLERIFILGDGEWNKLALVPHGPAEGAMDFEPIVTRK
jgi:hypothetical protein